MSKKLELLGAHGGTLSDPFLSLWATFALHFGVLGQLFQNFSRIRFFIVFGMDFGWVLASIFHHF